MACVLHGCFMGALSMIRSALPRHQAQMATAHLWQVLCVGFAASSLQDLAGRLDLYHLWRAFIHCPSLLTLGFAPWQEWAGGLCLVAVSSLQMRRGAATLSLLTAAVLRTAAWEGLGLEWTVQCLPSLSCTAALAPSLQAACLQEPSILAGSARGSWRRGGWPCGMIPLLAGRHSGTLCWVGKHLPWSFIQKAGWCGLAVASAALEIWLCAMWLCMTSAVAAALAPGQQWAVGWAAAKFWR
mmetsp:Transcript_3874/g.8561  ORF Transcript_3874/g.8561 Transcript_3874/m.8561 type:complete len:241 (-) Transcript_3874:906-1628(-)